jgi:hypothetical protein
MSESNDRRVLGAVRFRDAVTQLDVTAPLRVTAPGVRWVRNLRGWYVAANAPGLEAHTVSIDKPPTQPAAGKVPVALAAEDPTGTYLPRRALLTLPRDPDPAKKDSAASLFAPADVELFPTPAAPVMPGWAVLRVTVTTKAGKPAAGALLRVVRKGSGAELLGRGMTDARGEALVAVAGIPVTTWDEEGQQGVLAREVDARLDAHYTPAAAAAGDVDALGKLKAAASEDVKLASGRTTVVKLTTSA